MTVCTGGVWKASLQGVLGCRLVARHTKLSLRDRRVKGESTGTTSLNTFSVNTNEMPYAVP